MDPFTLLLTVAVGFIIISLWRTMTVFKDTSIPYETPLPIIGNMASVLLRKEHFVDKVTSMYKRWPGAKYIGYYDFFTPVIIVRDIDLIKDIAIKHFDNFPNHRSFIDEDSEPLFGKSLVMLKDQNWREVRNMLTPAFTANKMRHMSELMTSCAKDFADYIVNDTKQNSVDVDMKAAFMKYTNDVIATCAFGISVNSLKNPDNEFYVMGRDASNFGGLKGHIKIFFTRICPSLAKMLNVKVFNEKLSNFFHSIIESTIETRKKNNIYRPDMIQLMMEYNEKDDGVKLDLTNMTAQAFLFFFGGFESSSSLMSFASVALVLYPEIQKKLVEEIDEVTKQTNENPNYDQINAMPYLEAFLYETLRYYPIAGFLDRMCTKSFELPPAVPGGKPFTVEPGTNVWFPSAGIHEDPKYYDAPEKFDPNRFLNQKVTVNSPTFLGFGIGPRSCIGNRFALLETKLILFHLLSKCSLEKSTKLKEPIQLSKNNIGAIIEGGFWLKIQPRIL